MSPRTITILCLQASLLGGCAFIDSWDRFHFAEVDGGQSDSGGIDGGPAMDGGPGVDAGGDGGAACTTTCDPLNPACPAGQTCQSIAGCNICAPPVGSEGATCSGMVPCSGMLRCVSNVCRRNCSGDADCSAEFPTCLDIDSDSLLECDGCDFETGGCRNANETCRLIPDTPARTHCVVGVGGAAGGTCTSDTDCPGNGGCLGYQTMDGNFQSECLQFCYLDTMGDCSIGTCQDAFAGTLSVGTRMLGICAPCAVDADCPSTQPFCTMNICTQPCTTSSSCPFGSTCGAGRCM